MNTNTENHHISVLCGTDLERWRIENGLTKTAAADALGLPKAKWDEMTSADHMMERIDDPVVAMLLCIYQQYPESVPFRPPPDVQEFYDFLGFQDTAQDRARFATLIGRSQPSMYRLLRHNGNPGRPVTCWMDAIRRLKLTPKQSVRLMADIASSVGERQGVGKVLIQGWTKQNDDE